MKKLRRALLGGVVGLLALAPIVAQARNVLLIVADDVGVDASGFYPSSIRKASTPPAPKMPNLARLTGQGVVFRTAWGTPECSPSRATILTGRYGLRTGVGAYIKEGRPELSKAETALPEVLSAAYGNGLYLQHVGKWHVSTLGPTEPLLHGWPRYVGPGTPLTNMPNYFVWKKNTNGVSKQSKVYATTDQVDEAIIGINNAKAQAVPYVIWLASNAPHAPYHKPPNALITRDALPATGASDRAYYEAMLESLDTEVGRLLKSVDLATTTVIYIGDNGTPESVIASPYPDRGKNTVYEGGLRVPLLIAGAGVAQPGRIANGLVSSVDLFPTILELSGLDDWRARMGKVKVDGISLLPYMANTSTGIRRTLYAERFIQRYDSAPQRAIRDQTHKLISQHGRQEFYDLTADPFENRNLLQGTLTKTQQTKMAALERSMAELLATR